MHVCQPSVPVLAALVAVPGQIDQQAAMAFFLIGAVHVALMLLALKVAGTMVSGWQVFGQLRPGGARPQVSGVHWLETDLQDSEALCRQAHGAQVVVHAGATHGFTHRGAPAAYQPAAEQAAMQAVQALLAAGGGR